VEGDGLTLKMQTGGHWVVLLPARWCMTYTFQFGG
jgi:hypothetical protein